MAETIATCPFCSITSESELAIQLHIEDSHSDDAPTAGVDLHHEPSADSRHNDHSTGAQDVAPEWVKCDRVDCGEYMYRTEIDQHLAFHIAIDTGDVVSDGDPRQSWEGPSNPASNSASSSKAKENQRPTGHDSTQMNLLDYFSGNSSLRKQKQRKLQKSNPNQPGRLGKRELGPHAFEKEMPAQVRRHLLNDAEPRQDNRIGSNGKLQRVWTIDNETSHVIPVLADLCALDPTTTATYFSSPKVKHIVKIRCDGNFCGYWNIQMLLAHLQLTNTLPEMHSLPNVLQIQETIEAAWRNGICVYGKTETGGIQNTRKWIGTQEVVAYFTQIGVPVTPLSFDDEECSGTNTAVSTMLDHVEAYFMGGLERAESHSTSTITQLPPIYFQRLGHSMTIVGLERKADGSRNLLMFDPSLTTSDGIRRLANGNSTRTETKTLLRPYRRSDVSLSHWDEFEIVV